MNRIGLFCAVLAATGMAAGCNETHNPGEDAAITFDAAFPDGGLDAGPPPVNIGDPCRGEDDCDGTESYCDDEFPGGHCSQVCADDLPCPDGSTCVESGGGGGPTSSDCYQNCDFDAADGDFCARDGYGCIGDLGICFPGCDVDDECPSGLVCDVGGGFSGSGQCADPSATLGDACDETSECPPDTFCLSERFSGIPGGACGAFGCDPDSGMGCPENGTCVPAGRGGGVCLLACDDDADCTRMDQGCASSANGGYCGPSFAEENLGTICSAGRGDCTGGACLSESESGYPDSYCVAIGCDVAAQTGCPGDGVCIDGADGMGVCLDGCAADTDCRAGYACRPSDESDASSPTACVPACEDSDVCGNDTFECNPATGLCTEPFDASNLGEPCSDAGDCPGGLCMSEPGSGWPAGTCGLPGCRLRGSGPAVDCPMGSACVDDGTGDPQLGICVDECTMPVDCRPGYDCDGGACIPACADTDCGMARTCNMSSGLCE